MPGDVLLADGLAERALHQGDAALPAGPQLRGAVEGAAVEVEVGLDEVVGEVRRGGAQHVAEQPVAPVLDGGLVEDLRQVLEVRRLPDAHLGDGLVGAAEVGDVGGPVEVRAELGEVAGGQQVVGLLDVAGLGALPVALGELGVQRQDGGRRGRRVLVAAELEQPLEVLDVLVADLGELVVAVVGLVGQAEPALGDVEEVAVGLAVVGVDVRPEQAVAAEPLELTEERRQVAHVAQPGHRLDERAQRAGAEPVDPLGVHERRVEVADLAGVLVDDRPVGARLDDPVDLLLGRVGQLHERAPAGPVGGDLHGLRASAR